MSSPQYRMIAIDLDGTLLSPAGEVTPRTKEAVHRALRAGLLVCFATGRNMTESQMVLDAVAHYDTAVFVGGAMVIDTRQRTTLHRTAMQPDLAREVCATLESLGHAALALQDTGEAGVDYLISDGIELNFATVHWIKVTHAAIHKAKDLATAAHEHTIRVGIVAAPEESLRVQRILFDRFDGRIVCHSIHVPAYGVDVLEVFDPAVNKWEGILHVARRHGILPNQIIAVGDDINDITMLQNAGLGVAMGNAKAEALAVADRVINRNDADGLAEFLEELVQSQAVAPVARPTAGA
jgi:Cof subfamily protein (haloacid dehalogenase superfamily)